MCDWLNLFYGYDTIAVDKVDGCGLSKHSTLCMPDKEDEVDAILAIEREFKKG